MLRQILCIGILTVDYTVILLIFFTIIQDSKQFAILVLSHFSSQGDFNM